MTRPRDVGCAASSPPACAGPPRGKVSEGEQVSRGLHMCAGDSERALVLGVGGGETEAESQPIIISTESVDLLGSGDSKSWAHGAPCWRD